MHTKTLTGVAILLLAGCASHTTQPGTTSLPADPPAATSSLMTGSGLPTTSQDARSAAVAFTNAFLDVKGKTPAAWRQGLTSYVTPDLAEALKTVSLSRVSSGSITDITLYADGEANNMYELGTTSMGTLRVTVEVDPRTGKWLVTTYQLMKSAMMPSP